MAAAMTVTRRSAMAGFGLGLFPAIAGAAAPETCGAPADMHDSWQTAAPAAEGLDPKLLCAIGPRLETLAPAEPNAVVIVRHGMLVYQRQFGTSPVFDALVASGGSVAAEHRIASITKSVVALLTGIAFDRGYLKSLDAPVFSFFPEYNDLRTPDKSRITLRNLLTMTSGLQWPELTVSYTSRSNIESQRVFAAPDPYRFALQQPLVFPPGTMWNYNSGGVGLLGAILKKAAGRPLDQFAEQALFDPLGIRDWAWLVLKNGDPWASGGLLLRPRDLAKIGQLVLGRGAWRGRQVVSADWIRQMTSPQLPRSSPFSFPELGAASYGYLWWLGRSWVTGRPIDWVAGVGWGGQRLYVVPNLDMAVAVTAGVDGGKAYAQSLAGNTALDLALHAAIEL